MKYLFFFIILVFPFLSHSQERKIYITSKTASELASKFRVHDSVRRELILTKRELYIAKRKLYSADSNTESKIIFLDSVYGQKIFEQKKIINDLKKENSTINKKIRRRGVIVILLSIGLIFSILVN